MDKLVIIGFGWWACEFFLTVIFSWGWMAANEEDAHDPDDFAEMLGVSLSVILVFYILALWLLSGDLTAVLIAASAAHSASMLFLLWITRQHVFAVLAGTFAACGALQYLLGT